MYCVDFLTEGGEKLRLLKAEGKRRKPRKPGAAFIRQSNQIHVCRLKKVSVVDRVLSKLQIYSDSEQLAESERLNIGY